MKSTEWIDSVKTGDSFVVDFPKFHGTADQLPRADVVSVNICVDGSIIWLTDAELPALEIGDSPFDRGYRDELAGSGWYSNPYPEHTVEFRRWVDGKVQAIIDERTKHEG